MATIINNPPSDSPRSGGGMGFLLGVIVLIVFAAIFIIYILPLIGRGFGGTQINVPSDLNVNLQQK